MTVARGKPSLERFEARAVGPPACAELRVDRDPSPVIDGVAQAIGEGRAHNSSPLPMPFGGVSGSVRVALKVLQAS